MIRIALTLLAASLLACGGSTPAPQTPEAPTAPATPDAPAPEATPDAPPPATSMAPPAPRVDGPEYSDAWLVILASNSEPGPLPPAIDQLRSEDNTIAGAQPGTLDSSRFKGLMPCYEVVFAYAGPDKAHALELSKDLKAAKIDNYVKNAGKYVGARPAVEAFCARQREGQTTSCPANVLLAHRERDRVFVDLGLTGDVAERALASRSGPEAVVGPNGHNVAAPLGAQTLGGLSIGDSLHVAAASGGEMTACAVEEFVALTRGTPHWGWYDGPKDGPMCGNPEVFARLDCDLPDAALASRAPLAPRAVREVEAEPITDALIPLLQTSAAWKTAMGEARARAEGETLEQERTFERWRLGDRELLVVDAWIKTGEGFDECGGGDVNLHVRGVVENGAIVVPFRDATYESWLGLLDLGGDGSLEVISYSFPSVTTIHRADGEPLCGAEIAYCDCPC